jgi:hypothetical protein
MEGDAVFADKFVAAMERLHTVRGLRDAPVERSSASLVTDYSEVPHARHYLGLIEEAHGLQRRGRVANRRAAA